MESKNIDKERPVKKLLAAALVFSISSVTIAHSPNEHQGYRSDDLRKEVRRLRKDIARLESLILELTEMVEHNRSERPIDYYQSTWACYITDLRAGALYANGRSKVEAKGKVLKQCTDKKGACFESNIKCSRSDD